MAFKNLIQSQITKLVEALTPRFIGRDQDHLLAFGDELVGDAYEKAWENDQPLYDFKNTLQSNAGASVIHTADGSTVQAKLDAAAAATGTYVLKSGDTMSGKLTNSASLHISSGTAVFGAPTPESLYWNYTYPGNTYVTMDKATADNDASHVFTQASRAKWEVGATTENPGASPRYHIKKVRNPDSDPAHDQFIDLMIGDYDTETMWITTKLGIGTVPVDKLHVFETGNTGGRTISTVEHFNNSGSGSQSAATQYKGASNAVSWISGNDYGLNGGNNWFVAPASGGISLIAFTNGVAVNTSTLAATEAFRVESTTGGILPPRMTTAQRDAMGGKNTGLFIFNTTTNIPEYWDGTAVTWKPMTPQGVVDLSSNQTISGTKTFNISPVVPTPATADNSTNAASTAFVQTNLGSYMPKTGGNFTGGVGITSQSILSIYDGNNTNANLEFRGGYSSGTDGNAYIANRWTGVGKGAIYIYAKNGGSILKIGDDTAGITFNANQMWHAGNFDPATKANLSGATFTGAVAVASSLSASNTIASTGASAGLFFDNRSGTARQYGWYATANSVRLNISGIGDRFTIDESGNVTNNGTLTAANNLFGTGRIIAKDSGSATTNPSSGKTIQMYYMSGVRDAGALVAYDYTAASYKQIYMEASDYNFTIGGSSVATISNAGTLTATNLATSNSSGAYFNGNASGTQHNGSLYMNGTLYQLAQDASVWVRQPRVFVQSTDPGAKAVDGDVWIQI